MVDGGNLGGPGNFDISKIDFDLLKKVAEQPTEKKTESAPQKSNGSKAQTERENRVYQQKPSSLKQASLEGQEKLNKDEQANKKIEEKKQEAEKKLPSGLDKDYKVKNVAVEIFLRNRDNKSKAKDGSAGLADKAKNKKKAPRQSLRTKLSPKGPINPNRVKPALSGRHRASQELDPKKILQESLGRYSGALEDLNLITQYAKKLMDKGVVADLGFTGEQVTLAEILGFDESVASMDKESLVQLLAEKLENLDSSELKPIVNELINQLNQADQNPLKPFLQLFFPLPFPFLMLDLDDEFFEDEKELFEDEEFEDEEGDDTSEEDDDDEEATPHYDVDASISINTINYGKLHLHLRHSLKDNKVRLSMKGDRSAAELTFAIEAEIEKVLNLGNIQQDELKYWHDNVLRITESRSLQINSMGKLNPTFLKTCNALLETVYKNDAEGIPAGLDGDYTIL